MFTGFRWSFTKSYIQQNKSNDNQGCCNLTACHNLIEIHSSPKTSSAQIAAYAATIARDRSLVNISGSDVTKAAASHITTKLVQIPENTFNCALVPKEIFMFYEL